MSDRDTGYTWSESAKRFRDNATGRYLSEKEMVSLRDEFVENQLRIVDNISQSLIAGGMLLRQWEDAMTGRIRRTYVAEFLAGRGGRNAATQADYGAIGREIRNQRGYLRKFAEDIKAGNLTEAQISARSHLYVQSSRQAFERGKARAFDVALPAYPGDGSSICGANDKCHWSLKESIDRVEATWMTGGEKPCATCRDRAARWSPYTIEREEEEAA